MEKEPLKKGVEKVVKGNQQLKAEKRKMWEQIANLESEVVVQTAQRKKEVR